MQLFYKAVTKQGKVINGRVEAKDKSEAARYLRSHEIFPIKISEETEQAFSRFVPAFRHATDNDLIFFTRQLASMLESGLTLMQSLNVLKDQVRDKFVSEILQGLTADIQDGRSFGQALARYPKFFYPVYISLIKAGEKSGLLDKVLDRLATNLEKSRDLKDTIRAALLYPIIIIFIMIAVIGIMMVFVIPQLASLYTGLNVQLPFLTKVVIGMSNFFVTSLPLVAIMAVVIIYLFRKYYHSVKGKMIVDKAILKIPLIGHLTTESILVEFTRTFSLLIGTGSLVVDSLQQCATTVDNAYYKQAIAEVASRVEKGVLIGDALSANELFPPILVETVKIGEQTGKTDEALMRISVYFEREVQQIVKALTTTIEPVVMIIIGISVGFLIVSVITPIYSLISAIH